MISSLTAAVQRRRELVTAAGLAFIATDLQGTIVEWNPPAERLYGWSAREVEGRSILDVTPAEISRAQAAEIMETLVAGDIWSGNFMVRGREGDAFVASVTDLPMLDGDSRAAGVIGVSARATKNARLCPILETFCAAAESMWPAQVVLRSKLPAGTQVRASEPHLLQLLLLLLEPSFASLDEGREVIIDAAPGSRTILGDFGIGASLRTVYLRIAVQVHDRRRVVLREMRRGASVSNVAPSLVREAAGWLFAGSTPPSPAPFHLLLPLAE